MSSIELAKEFSIDQSQIKGIKNVERQAAKSFDKLDPPLDIVDRCYSLTPDMVGGWKPKKIERISSRVPFQIKYQDTTIELLLKQLKKNTGRSKEKLVYIGPLRQCSVSLHDGMPYRNPYGRRSKLQLSASWIKDKNRDDMKLQQCELTFDSAFECGNLDLAVRVEQKQYDLYMRVDTNTQGHTHWYYFLVKNKEYTGKVQLNICNFRRAASLYQKGLKPYVKSMKGQTGWQQEGENVNYGRFKRTYDFMAQSKAAIQGKYFSLSFLYEFKHPHDQVSFAYCIPYTYSQLLTFVDSLKNTEIMTPLRSLSGLAIPQLRITNQDIGEQSKKVAIITGRVHPGESNGSYVMQGFLECLCGDSPISVKLRSKYIFYVLPMLNPDGVVAGNYRSSLFGKDLNRTYSQARKFAFPETYHLIELAKKLKIKHKRRFCLYIDIHGHSSKKNIFMFGPEHSIQTNQYEHCRQLPKILSHLTPYFRYYLCSFRISGRKESTARAVFSRKLDIPYSYTMENSNGIFLDHQNKQEQLGSVELLKQIGHTLGKGLAEIQIDRRIPKIFSSKLSRKSVIPKSQQTEEEAESDDDDDIDESDQDLPQQFLLDLENAISQGKSSQSTMVVVNKEQKPPAEVLPNTNQGKQIIKNQSKSPQVKQSKSPIKKKSLKKLYLQEAELQISLMVPKTNFNHKQKLKTQISRNNRYKNTSDRGTVLPVLQFRNNPIFMPRLKTKQTGSKSQHYASQPKGLQSSVRRSNLSVMIYEMDSIAEKKRNEQLPRKRQQKNHKVLESLLDRLKTIK